MLDLHLQRVIVGSHFNEDLRWLKKVPLIKYIYSHTTPSQIPESLRNDPSFNLRFIPNTGREASSYLSYIVDEYDNLPKEIAFIHSHERAWHQSADLERELLSPFTTKKRGFHGMNRTRFNWETADPIVQHSLRIVPMIIKSKRIPDCSVSGVRSDCCAQFITTREKIREISKEDWFNLLRYITNLEQETNNPKIGGFVLEYTWHILLGNPCIFYE